MFFDLRSRTASKKIQFVQVKTTIKAQIKSLYKVRFFVLSIKYLIITLL